MVAPQNNTDPAANTSTSHPTEEPSLLNKLRGGASRATKWVVGGLLVLGLATVVYLSSAVNHADKQIGALQSTNQGQVALCQDLGYALQTQQAGALGTQADLSQALLQAQVGVTPCAGTTPLTLYEIITATAQASSTPNDVHNMRPYCFDDKLPQRNTSYLTLKAIPLADLDGYDVTTYLQDKDKFRLFGLSIDQILDQYFRSEHPPDALVCPDKCLSQVHFYIQNGRLYAEEKLYGGCNVTPGAPSGTPTQPQEQHKTPTPIPTNTPGRDEGTLTPNPTFDDPTRTPEPASTNTPGHNGG